MHFHLRPRRRSGITVFEITVAIAFLAVVMVFVLNMHRTNLNYNRIANERLRKQLAIENVREQLLLMEYDTLSEQAEALIEKSDVELAIKAFESGERSGLHIRIQINSESGPLEDHVWQLEPQS